jgi:hypothetical protein
MGFWKGPNGQNLIGTYCAPAGKTGLALYLYSLGAIGQGPFLDASGKSCSQLQTYVTSILKGATATNMNVMLRAQMLATALSAYFSDPNLGYRTTSVNSIKPPSTFLTQGSLAGLNVDLTAICPMVDNTTTGSALCAVANPSTNGFASGAYPKSCWTVGEILNYEATLNPLTFETYAGPFYGTPSAPNWYNGNATKETIVKNMFDQINNVQAFSCP